MEIPFYYSFKEFKENYETDLKKWLEVYTEGEEKYYLDEIDKIYKYSINSEYIEVKYYGDPYPECKEIELNVYFKIIQNRLEAYIEVMKLNPTNEYEYESFITHEIFNNEGKFKLYDDDYPISIYEDWYILDYYSFYHCYSTFLKVSTTLFDEFRLDFDSVKFINFQFAKGKIINFINERRKLLNEKSQSTPPDEVEPIALPENIKTTKTDTIRLLHYTGILEFLLKKYPRMNESNLASFFELITKTPITHKNQNKQFYKNTDDSMYHKDNLDLILSKFNMIAENTKK